MLHIYYKIKCLLRSREMIFWSLCFPLLLGTMFYFSFGSINEQFKQLQIHVGIVHSGEEDYLEDVMDEIETDDGKPLFIKTEYEDVEAAERDLKNKKIDACIDFNSEYAVTVMESSIQTTIVKSVVDEYKANAGLVKEVAEDCYAENQPEKFEMFMEKFAGMNQVTIEEIPLKGTDKDPFTQYFFALLAMTCLIASQCGADIGINIQPNMSVLGARRNVSPMKKMTQILYDFIGTFFIYCVITAIVVLVCVYGFHRDFGDSLFLVLLATWTGSFTGMTAGIMISVWVPGGRMKKGAVCTLFFMLSSFLAGLQWADIVHVLEKSCPIVNRINPGTLITGAYSALTVFGDVREYTKNVVTLAAMGILFLILSILKLRRERYANL